MTNYYVRETPDGADVLNRISVTISALVCTCYEVSTAQQIVNALNAQAPPAAVPADTHGDEFGRGWNACRAAMTAAIAAIKGDTK